MERALALDEPLPLIRRALNTGTNGMSVAETPSRETPLADIHSFLQSGDGYYVVVDDPLVERIDFPEREIVRHFYYQDEVYLFMDPLCDPDMVRDTIGLPPSWLLTGVLTVVPPELLRLSWGEDVTRSELELVAAGVEQVFAGAWDGEGIVFWAPDPGVKQLRSDG